MSSSPQNRTPDRGRQDRCPPWAEPALQAIAFWIGWNHTRYRHWPLTEGALVGELQRLIASEIASGEVLCAEVGVNDLCGSVKSGDATIRQGRVDLVLATKVNDKEKGRAPKGAEFREEAVALIEVKRSQSGWGKIRDDIVRLSALSHHLNEGVRCFVIVTSEGGFGPLLGRLVNRKKRTALKGWQSLDGANVKYRVRRLCRAQATLSPSNSAHCACLVEVYGKP